MKYGDIIAQGIIRLIGGTANRVVELNGDKDITATREISSGTGGNAGDLLNRTGVQAEVGSAAPAAHKTSHQNGGGDEISVAGLSGELADNQPPKTHVASHANGGGDELSVLGLSGKLADAQDALAHKTSHESGGADVISFDNIANTVSFIKMTPAERTKLGNLVEGYLGWFADEAALNLAHPTGSNGQNATLGSTDTLWAWDADTAAWVDTDTNSLGDMLKATYDPSSKNASAFDMDNMDQGSTNKFATANEKLAMGGTVGSPGSGNEYVTNTDGRVPSQDENDALAGTVGAPSSANKYVTDSDTRIPTQDENNALAGTSGIPSTSNKYVTDSDSRLTGSINDNALLIIKHEETDGTNGGVTTATTWTVCTFNQKPHDSLGATLSSNQITGLAAGNYIMRGYHTIYASGRAQLRLRKTNATAATKVNGMTEGGTSQGKSVPLDGRFSLSGGETLEIEYFAGSANATDGLGVNANTGEVETYGYIEIAKVG